MPQPISVARALEIVLSAVTVLPRTGVGIEEVAGRFLAGDILADRDAPPFDKALMDGFALNAAGLAAGPARLSVTQEIKAGTDPGTLRPLAPGCAARIMTGAPMPPGADAVLMVEDSSEAPGDPGAILARRVVQPGDNMAHRGKEVRAGEPLLTAGDFVGAGEVAVLAACGCDPIPVYGRPRVVIAATGDELVPPSDHPGPGQIRNSNSPMLAALARRMGAEVRDLGILRDDRESLRTAILSGLDADMLILSGGVSMGAYDLVGAALKDAGVEVLFERVAIRPGKPFTFGRRGKTLVAGCPGNPVSSFVIFQVFLRPALRRMMGSPRPRAELVQAVLSGTINKRQGLTSFHQARARFEGGRCVVEPVPTTGSADFASCARGNALIVAPPESDTVADGAMVEVLLLEDHADR